MRELKLNPGRYTLNDKEAITLTIPNNFFY